VSNVISPSFSIRVPRWLAESEFPIVGQVCISCKLKLPWELFDKSGRGTKKKTCIACHRENQERRNAKVSKTS